MNKIKYKELNGTSTSAGTIGLQITTSNAILAILNRNDDRVEIKLRRDSGNYYAAAYNWDGTPQASYAYKITVVYASWTDLKPVT